MLNQKTLRPMSCKASRGGSTPSHSPLPGLKGKVVLLDFWTYTCVNCIRTLPFLREWHRKYRDLGLTIVRVHLPSIGVEAGSIKRRTSSMPVCFLLVGVAHPQRQSIIEWFSYYLEANGKALLSEAAWDGKRGGT